MTSHHRSIWISLLALALLLGCPSDDDDSVADDDAGDDDDGGPVEFVFALGVIADPHITGNVEHTERLDVAVAWMNQHAAERSIELVVVLGDLGWGNGLPGVKDQLDALTVPYVPFTGDNEIQGDSEEEFYDTFTPQWELLATELDAFDMASMPVYNPEIDGDSWFNIFSFDHRGVHFAGTDWCARVDGTILGELGDLHDFAGGTWPWLEADLEGRFVDPDDSIILLSHIPMHIGMFDVEEVDKIEVLFDSVGDAIYANLAGHVHLDSHHVLADGLYEVFTYDATWDDEVTVGLVEVSGNDQRFEYTHELHIVPYGD